MSLFSQFETDKTKEVEGVAVNYAPNDDGTIPTFYVARIGGGNTKYSAAIKRLSKKYKRQIQLDTLPDEQMTEIAMLAFVEGALRGWENIQDQDGKNIEYTIDNAISLFKTLPDLFNDLISQANDIELFKTQSLEKDIKN